jgi:1,4-dihydroxy-6-naphthoate synthase
MARAALSFALSPCPNDTFALHALVHGLVGGPPVEPRLDDIEALNARAERGAAEATKISVAAYGRVRDRYLLLRAGGAAGFGVGPIVVARRARDVGGRVAIPGERTTAALLLRLLGRFETVAMRFDHIEDAVLSGAADCGVLIHEGRFTYRGRGLVLLRDLGEVWEERMRCPLPLGAIALRRDLAPVAGELDAAIGRSVEHAWARPADSREYVRAHAREMDPAIVERHIRLYVNEYTRSLDEAAVERLLAFAAAEGLCPPPTLAAFAG